MYRTQTANCVKLCLLTSGAFYLLWYGSVQFANFSAQVPEYRLVPLATNPELYEKIRRTDRALAERMLIEERVETTSRVKLSVADERSLKWLVAKRFPLLPRRITRFTVGSPDEVWISVRRVPWGTVRKFTAGRDARGWFLFIGDGHEY